MRARPDGVAIADRRPSLVPVVCIVASHDLDIAQSVMRLQAAARVATTSASLAFKSTAVALLHPSCRAERRNPFGGFGDRF
ncbi:hypothetical protein JQ594_12270 [Bradyrhizobium manausense]|uniref:hypothetical protein n=1 Tax=Bradyrhizobium manausense TaxID=989370 RepID=UPI001BA7BF87|nr:hypothetical protein [Bradyrhizobium manausense]MBR0686696.1 hypothetical protein [Bradyrhizobium manausense]